MTHPLVRQYRRWFEYEQDAHRKVLASLETVPSAGRQSPSFRRAVDIFAHVLAARRTWLYRFGVAEKPPDLFPKEVQLEGLAAEVETVHAAWSAYLDRLDEAELNREFEYQSFDGGRFRNRAEDILAQLFGHSWYHRGQIAMLVKTSGGEPAATDLVFWTRTPAGDAIA